MEIPAIFPRIDPEAHEIVWPVDISHLLREETSEEKENVNVAFPKDSFIDYMTHSHVRHVRHVWYIYPGCISLRHLFPYGGLESGLWSRNGATSFPGSFLSSLSACTYCTD